MKKTLAIVAIIATLTSCGGGKTTTPATTDSTATQYDSTKCDSTIVIDSTEK
jgi:uncharacterized lipoprotein YajG